jgi:diguanylate cyclase (GGDEF)-like protein
MSIPALSDETLQLELAHRTARYGALDLVQQPVWIYDFDRLRVHWANAAALKVWKAESLQELCSRDMGADISATVARRLAQYQADFITHAAVFNERWTLYPGGTPVVLNIIFSGHRLDDGRMAMLSQGKPALDELPESTRSVEALLHTAVMITLYDLAGAPLYRNPAARASVRRLGETLRERIVDAVAGERFMTTLEHEQAANFTLAVHTAQGERWHEMSARRCHDAVTGHDAILVSEADVSTLKRTEAQARFQAMHDALTGLPNRAHVMQQFAQALSDIHHAGLAAALIFIDLDNFKNVNDTLGHAAGDDLLVQTAQRLRQATRGGDRVARLGGDEFLILVASRQIVDEVEQLRKRIGHAVAQPLTLSGTEVRVTSSMGVSLYPRDGVDIETLLRNADLAMYCAKERGRNDMAYYEEGLAVALRERTSLEADMRRALERGEFEVHYQPRVCVRTRRILGAEALLRWRSPEHGLVQPDAFIPACESSGLIMPIGLWVFEQVARQQARWAAGGLDLQISVNLSPRQFSHPGLLDDMRAALRGAASDPSRLEIEITESMLLAPDERPHEVLDAIQSMGMSIALDDFGTGYSNLAALQRYPIHTVKIDKTFIQALGTDRPLAEMIVSMCRLMHLTVVAEGVETIEQLDWIAGRGIDQYQGFLCARALPAAEFEARFIDNPLVV